MDTQILERMHESFCGCVQTLGDDVSPMVIVLKREEPPVPMLIAGGSGDDICGVLHSLAFDCAQVRAVGCEGIMVHAVAWSAPASAGERPAVLGERGDPRATSIAISVLCALDHGQPYLTALTTQYDPTTKVLGQTETAVSDRTIMAMGRIASSLAAATLVCAS